MSSIQRWSLGDSGQIFCVYGAEGEWVRYEDHLKTVEHAGGAGVIVCHECQEPVRWADGHIRHLDNSLLCGEARGYQEQIAGRQNDMVISYLRGLDAAREAVRNSPFADTLHTDVVYRIDALAAIDQLREKKQ